MDVRADEPGGSPGCRPAAVPPDMSASGRDFFGTPTLPPKLLRKLRPHLDATSTSSAKRRANGRRGTYLPLPPGRPRWSVLGLVTLHVLIAENQFRLDAPQQQTATQQADYEKLRLHVAELESPARIVSVAEGRLGLQQPGSVTYLPAISTGDTITSPGVGASSGGCGAEVLLVVPHRSPGSRQPPSETRLR